MCLPSSGSNKPLNWIKKAEIAPRFTANLIFRLFRFPSAHAYWPSCARPVLGRVWWHSLVLLCSSRWMFSAPLFCCPLCMCAEKWMRVCVCVCVFVCVCMCKFGGGHSCIVELFSASFLSGSFDTRLAHTWARPLPIHQPAPRQHTHLRTATGTVSNTQTLALIGQKLVAAKNVLSKFRALVFFYLTLLFWWGWLDFVSSL